MNCSTCGSQLDHPGQGHTCLGGATPLPQPPGYWQAAQWALVTLATLFAGLSLVRAAITADLLTPPSGKVISALSIAGPLALFAAFLTWSNVTKRVIEAHSIAAAAVRHWAIGAGALLLALSYLLPMKTPTAFHVVRAAAAILLGIGALITHRRAARRLAEPATPAPQSNPTGTGIPPLPINEARPGQVPPQVGSQPARLALDIETQPEDWNASLWDPEVQRDIERRRRQQTPPA
ncbi:hypothetical protein ACLQ3H_11380 [Micromonospora saelicesensis]|uniref:hypothetical protein n=1 Tax=Micromonospora saelicesensis TaxID=285676 RepID=UPI000DBF9563|nr:hypothetical protein [Micromonospora saelicesensis]RAO61427.1 hypothetical protein LUPAC06_00898 [Micromonospora saelicesensis]